WNSTPFSKILKEGDGCQVRFFVGIPKGLSVMPATVSKVEGVAHLILVDEGSEVIVDDLESLIEKTIDHPVLKDGGFDLTMALKSFSLPKTLPVPLPEGDDGSRRELTIAWNSPDVTREEWQEMAAGTYPGIYSVQLIDQNGKLLLDQSGGYYGGKTATGKLERCEWSIGLDPKQDGLPQGVRLRIRLASKVSLVKFPFSFEDVPVFLNEKPKTP
ncbi:MAG: hypothetical protein KDA66_13725, partial [Planctomycetaceae bacterium]|nr:hypothetical protein [Planctomycetaceae bacterium]